MTGTTQPEPHPDALLRAKLNLETAQVGWLELQRHFAAGRVIHVSSPLDLVEAAFQFTRDNKSQVQAWIDCGLIGAPGADQARQWVDQEASLWAVVVAPWVLVQDRDNEDREGAVE